MERQRFMILDEDLNPHDVPGVFEANVITEVRETASANWYPGYDALRSAYIRPDPTRTLETNVVIEPPSCLGWSEVRERNHREATLLLQAKGTVVSVTGFLDVQEWKEANPAAMYPHEGKRIINKISFKMLITKTVVAEHDFDNPTETE